MENHLLNKLNYSFEKGSQKRSYESLTIGYRYKIEKIRKTEDEMGMKISLYFNEGKFFINLPQRYAIRIIDNWDELNIDQVMDMTYRVNISFMFNGWDDEGMTKFLFVQN